MGIMTNNAIVGWQDPVSGTATDAGKVVNPWEHALRTLESLCPGQARSVTK